MLKQDELKDLVRYTRGLEVLARKLADDPKNPKLLLGVLNCHDSIATIVNKER